MVVYWKEWRFEKKLRGEAARVSFEEVERTLTTYSGAASSRSSVCPAGHWRRSTRPSCANGTVDNGQGRTAMTSAILTENLGVKQYGKARGIVDLDLEVFRGRDRRVPRPERGGEDHDHSAAARPHPPDRGAGRDIRSRLSAVGPSRHIAVSRTFAGEANLWPGLTGAETLHLLGRVQGHVDPVYRANYCEGSTSIPSKQVRAYSKGNRQKLILIAALDVSSRPPRARRADQRPRPLHGAGLPPLHDEARTGARRSSCRRTS